MGKDDTVALGGKGLNREAGEHQMSNSLVHRSE